MKMPPPGERYVAANWIAVGVALLAALAGAATLQLVWDDLPEEVALRSTLDGQSLFVSPATAILIGAVATLAACVVWLGVGVVVHRSSRHRLAGPAAGSAVAVAIMIFGVVWDQRQVGDAEDLWPVVASGAGLVVGWAVYWWSRPPSTQGVEASDPAPALAVPDSSRLAWVGTCRMSWTGRLWSGALRAVPLLVIYYWLGMISGYWGILVVVGFAVVFVLVRDKQVAVDYSGVGLRQRNGTPSPVPMHQIRSASVQEISVPRDFGGWGDVKAPDGRQGWITRSGDALVVHRHDKPDFVFTVDNAAEAAAVLNTLVARYQSRDQTLTA